jgi:hypothetical protein
VHVHGIDWIAGTGFLGLIARWAAFAAVFAFRKKQPKTQETKRDSASHDSAWAWRRMEGGD